MPDRNSSSIPEETYESLIEATLIALIKHGYSDLTVRDIDDEWEKSRQLINYYFDGKDELLTTVLIDLIGTAEEALDPPSDDDPLSKLNNVLDTLLLEPTNEEIRYWEFLTAIYEMQAQAHRQPAYQEIFNKITDEAIEHLSEIISDGINEGVFRSVDPVAAASLTDTIVTGAHIKKVHLGRDDAPKRARKTIDEFIVTQLLDDDSD